MPAISRGGTQVALPGPASRIVPGTEGASAHRAEGASAQDEVAREREREATWQEVCTRNGFAVERCPRCDLPLEYTPFPASPTQAAAYRALLQARARERLARAGPREAVRPP